MTLLDRLLKRTFFSALIFVFGVLIPLSIWNTHKRVEEHLQFLVISMMEQLRDQATEGDLVSLQRLFAASSRAIMSAGESVEVRLTRNRDGKLVAYLKSDSTILVPVERKLRFEAPGYGPMDLSIRLDISNLILEHTALAVIAVGLLVVLLINLRRRLIALRSAIMTMELDGELTKISTQFAHDIRSPLSALHTVLYRLQTQDPQLAELTKSALQRIDYIGMNLLDHYRNLHATVLPDQLLAMRSEVEARFPGRTKWPLEVSEISTLASQHRNLTRILQNLIINALESGDASKVEIGFIRTKRLATFSVSDDGPGFSIKILEALKQRKFLTTKIEGTGLGLRAVVQEVERAGGQIEFANGQVGARVHFTMPIESSRG